LSENAKHATPHKIERLMDAAPGSSEEDKRDVLATLVSVYEAEHYPTSRRLPGETG
jgi:antitoxin component HigA of HigAB toxin-antitoxin module